MNKISLFMGSLCMVAGGTLNVQADPEESGCAHTADRAFLADKKMAHIGIIVRDIEKSLARWGDFLGVEELPAIIIAAGHEDNPTHFKGHPSDAKAKLAFLSLDNLQVELIEPLEDDPSHWREFLETKGEGVHHIAFFVEGMGEHYLPLYAAAGMPVVQHGGWDGGEYGYMDTVEALGVTVELLENYNRSP